MLLTVRCPVMHLDPVLADLSARRAAMMGQKTMDDDAVVVSVSAPAANLFDYVNTLRYMTQGRGTFEMQFERYQLLPIVLPPDLAAS